MIDRIASLNLIDLLLDAVCVVAPDSRIIFVSAAFERIFGYTPEEAVGRHMLDLVHPQDLERTRAAAQNVSDGSLQLHFENRYVHKKGHTVHIRWTARWLPARQVRLAVAHDITETKRIEARQAAVYAIAKAAHSAAGLEALFAQVHQTIGELLDARNFAVALYDAARDELSYPYHVDSRAIAAPQPAPLHADARCAQVIRQQQAMLLTSPAEPAAPTAPTHRHWLGVPLLTQQGAIGALVLQGDGEAVRYTEQDKELLQFVSGQVAAAIEHQQLQARLQYMAQYDQLTGLPNRALLLDRLQSALERAHRDHTRLSLLFVDLDRFKQVNDNYGHPVGDLLLQQVAQRLRDGVRSADTVARLGGDEFVVLLEGGQSCTHAERVTRKILAAFAAPFVLQQHAVPMVPSIGAAVYPEHGSDAQQLLSHADAAMYVSKKRRAATAPRAGDSDASTLSDAG